eukprot:2373125-Pyramimonas_sp.AAC.1
MPLVDGLNESGYSVDGHAQTTSVHRSLNMSAKTQIIEIIRELIEHGADPNCCDDSGQTALHIAASVGAAEI